ncbi:adhesion G protein-coupled receptor B2 [Trichonephila clavipes]|nr:adhesion G protein-coupled receptor B2 [Trichonephila clavipes]
MGCTPSIQVNQSGVVRCSQDDDSNGNSQLIGVQGNFRATYDGVEGTSRETQQDSILLQDLSPYEEDIFKGSVFFQKNEAEEKERYGTLNCNKTTMYYSIDMNFFYSKDNLVALHFEYDFWHMTATAGSDVVQSGRPIFYDFFQHLWPYIGNNTANVVFQMVSQAFVAYPHRPMTLHSPTENSLAVLNHKILEAN